MKTAAPKQVRLRSLRVLPAPILALAVLTGAGGLMCLFSSLFPLSPNAPVALDAIAGGVLLLECVFVLGTGARLPAWVLHVFVAAATLTISVLAANAATAQGVVIAAFGYIWICVYVGHFFSPAAVRAHAVLISAAYGIALLANGMPATLTVWVIVTTTAFIAGETLSRLNMRLRDEANTDPLTGLLNRNGLSKAAGRQFSLADRTGIPVTAALIDLDDFKEVNDRGGHVAGDRLLVDLGEFWLAHLDETDILARYGGDEFVLVLPGVRPNEAQSLFDRLRIGAPIGWSAGVVERQPGEDLAACLSRADRVLYEMKRAQLGRAQPGAEPAARRPSRLVLAEMPSQPAD